MFFIRTRCPWGPIYGSAPNVSQSVHPTLCAHFKTDLTLTDEDTNSTVTDFRILSVKWRYHPPLQTKILSKKSYRLKGYTPTPLYWHIPGNFSQKRTKYCVCFLAFKNTCLWKKNCKVVFDVQSKALWQCKWCPLVAEFGTHASGASWWPNFEPMQVVPLGDPIYN